MPVQASSDNDLFEDISGYLSSYGSVDALAIYLFEGTHVNGDRVLKSLIQGGGFESNYKLARQVLDEWIKRSPTATPGTLYQVLQKVHPKAALDFESKLVRRF